MSDFAQVEVMNVADKSQKTETAFKLFDREVFQNIFYLLERPELGSQKSIKLKEVIFGVFLSIRGDIFEYFP